MIIIEMKYDWTNIYQEFASKILDYRDNRQELIKKLEEVYNELEIRYLFSV